MRLERRRSTGRRLALVLGPKARVDELLEHTVLDPHLSTKWHPPKIPRLTEELRVSGIRKNGDARIANLLADFVAAALLHEGRPPFVRTARVSVVGDELHEITNGLRLEYDGIAPWLECDWTA